MAPRNASVTPVSRSGHARVTARDLRPETRDLRGYVPTTSDAAASLPGYLKTYTENDRGCWIWTGYIFARSGYGGIRLPEWTKGRAAHRAVYESIVGPIPEGLELDHLCRIRSCVNPAHLQPVTHAENMRRTRGLPRTPHSVGSFPSAYHVVAAYVNARKENGLSSGVRERAILGREARRLIAAGGWEPDTLLAAARTYACTRRHVRFFAEWVASVFNAQSLAEHAERDDDASLAPDVAALIAGSVRRVS